MSSHNNVFLTPGTMIGKQYQIERVIGSGGFGITYRAKDLKNNIDVAVKEFFPGQCVTREAGKNTVYINPDQASFVNHMYQRFLDEGQSMYNLRDIPNMLKVYGIYKENNTAYLVLEFLDGCDLGVYLKRQGDINWDELSVYVEMVLKTLSQIHKRGVIHRDISPDNIFITRDKKARLIDYGSLRTYSLDSNMTTILKHSFAPVEQYRSDGKQGPWTDVYALSVTLYYALTGKLPPQAIERVYHDQLVPIREFRDDVPQNIEQIIYKGMQVKPENRYQNADEMYRALYARTKVYYIRGISGYFAQQQFSLQQDQMCLLGRGTSCQIRFPVDTKAVSRRQCSIGLNREGIFFLRDEGSSYGTCINGERVQDGIWVQIQEGDVISFGRERFICGSV